MKLWRMMTIGWLITFGSMATCGPPVQANEPELDITADVVYGHKHGMALTYDVLRPAGERNGVGLLFMVSGGWVSKWTEPQQTAEFVQPLLDAGYTILAVRHGSSPKYVIPEIEPDIKLALEHVHQHASDHGIDPRRLGVFGFSAGGHLSLLLGTQTNDRQAENAPQVAAVAAVFPPTDLAPYVEPGNPLRERFPALKFDPELAERYSPLKHVTPDDAPALLVHGDKDELVPLWHSEKLVAAMEQAGVPHRLLVIEGAAHGFDQQGNQRMYAAMVEWFDQHLQPSDASESR